MFFEERVKQIVKYITNNNRATVKELSKKFKVSEITIRRDLSYIEKHYNIKRTHGGAILYITEEGEFTFDEKFTQNIEFKKRIAQKAVEYIKEGQTVLIDGGSTNYQIALLLKNLKNLKIVTNSIPAAYILRNSENEIIFLGGNLRKKSFTVVGPLTLEVLKNFNIDIAFIGTTGLDNDGYLYSPSELEAFTKKEIIKATNFKVIVFDSSKAGIKSFAKFGNISNMDLIITNSEIDKEFLNKIRKYNSKIILS